MIPTLVRGLVMLALVWAGLSVPSFFVDRAARRFGAQRIATGEWDVVRVDGPLLLDHYMWVEFLDRYPDPPDLFYRVRIDRIRVPAVPERLITKSANGVAGPTSLRETCSRSLARPGLSPIPLARA